MKFAEGLSNKAVVVTSDPTKVIKRMIPDVETKRAEIERIAAIPMAVFVENVDMLTVALYAGDIIECKSYLDLPPNDIKRAAAEKAVAFHFDVASIQEAAKRKFIERNIRKLLKVAASTSDAGAKLAQVFFCFLNHAEEHRLSCSLVQDMDAFLHYLGQRDGFYIKGQLGLSQIKERFYIPDVD